MNVDKSKLYFIQSHDWGGQIFLAMSNELQLNGITQTVDKKNEFLKTSNINLNAFKNYCLCLLPSQTANFKGTYQVAFCKFNYDTKPTEPIVSNVSNNTPTESPISNTVVITTERLPPPIVIPPINIPSTVNFMNEMNNRMAEINRHMNEKRIEMENRIREAENRARDLQRMADERMRELNARIGANKTNLNSSNINPNSNDINNNPPTSFTISHILTKKATGFVFETYTEGSVSNTLWYFENIPNLTKAANVFLLKLHKVNDADDGKYLSLVWPIPDRINAEVKLHLTNDITTRAQLWNLVPLK